MTSVTQVRASAVFALGTLLDTGLDKSKVGDEYCDDDDIDNDEKVRAEAAIVKSLLNVVSDGSPLVRIEVVAGTSSIYILFSHAYGFFVISAATLVSYSSFIIFLAVKMKKSNKSSQLICSHLPCKLYLITGIWNL